MSGTALLEELTTRGVELWADGEQLRYRGPKKVLSPDVLAQLKESKPEIMKHILSEPQVQSAAEVFDFARYRFPDREDLPVPPAPPGTDPLVHRGTDKVKFFKGNWREAFPRDFEVYRGQRS